MSISYTVNNTNIDPDTQTTSENVPALRNIRLEEEFKRERQEIERLTRELKQSAVREARLEKEAYTDNLTGLFNERGFFMEGKKLLSSLRRLDQLPKDKARSQNIVSQIMGAALPFLINPKRKNDGAIFLFMDLDGFKDINDEHGHTKADEILKQIATLLSNNTRDEDIVGRLHGDEFAAIIRIRKEQDAKKFVNKLQTLLDDHHFIIDGEEIKVSGTIGSAMINLINIENSLETAKDQADDNMRHMKAVRTQQGLRVVKPR